MKYLWDGHHRVVAIWLGGRDVLYPSECLIVSNSTYELTSKIRWHLGFVTPFDPRIEVRSSNFAPFKANVLSLSMSGRRKEAEEHVLASRAVYCSPRTVHTVEQLAGQYNLQR